MKWKLEEKSIHIYSLTGATRVIDLTDLEYFAATANAIMQPMECATKWKDFKSNGQITDCSIISKCSLNVYKLSLGFGLFPNPRRSTANNLYLPFTDSDRFWNTVSVHIEEEQRNPCKNITFSIGFPFEPSEESVK